MDDAAGAHEEERLEEGVGEEVEHRPRHRTGTDGEEHVADLAHRRVGEDFLDLPLGEGAGRRVEGGGGADGGDHRHAEGGEGDQGEEPAEQVDAGSDHGRGVDQRRDRGRAGHGVGEPGHQRQLGALAAGAAQQQQGQRGQRRRRQGGRLSVDAGERQGAEEGEEPEHGDGEKDIADPGDEEGLAPGVGVLPLLVPVADQAVGAEADPLPAEEEQQQVVGEDDGQHGEDEEVEQREEARIVLFLAHVADGIEVDQGRDPGHHQRHGCRKMVEEDRQRDLQRADIHPGVEGGTGAGAGGAEPEEAGQHRGEEDAEDRQGLGQQPRQAHPEQGVEGPAQKRHQGYQEEKRLVHPCIPSKASASTVPLRLRR